MPHYLDSVPFSGIIRIRDMMYSVKDPFRLDQGDVSFAAPDTVKSAMHRAIDANHSHYLQTTGLPRLLDLLAAKLRSTNGIPVDSADELMVTTGGIHALYILCQALLEPGDEVVIPDPEWPPCAATILAARAQPIHWALNQSGRWSYVVRDLESKITDKTKAIWINSPHNPTGAVLTRADVEAIAGIVRERNLWLISDEAYEDVIFDDAEHISPASLPDMYERTISVFTFSKSYAMTGLRLGYLATKDARLRDRMKKVLFYTASNVTSIVQHGGIGALEGSQDNIAQFRTELQARRDLFYSGLDQYAAGILSGEPPRGAFYAFVKIDPAWRPPNTRVDSLSWSMAEHLITQGRIGCVPGVDFGPRGEGYLRFCFARDRDELTGALQAMGGLFAGSAATNLRSLPGARAAAPDS